MALNITELNSHSHQYFEDLVINNIYQKNIIFDRLKEKERISFSGGTKLHQAIRYQELSDSDMISPNAARVTSIKDTRTAIELNWKYAKCDVAISWEEQIANGPDGRIANLVADKALEGAQDLNKLLSTQFYQLYASKGSYDMDGFYSAVRASSTSYGGISQDDISVWNAGVYDTSTSTLAMYGTGSLDEGLRACYFETFPDLIATTLAIASIYGSKLQPGERRDPEDGKAGATDLYFNSVPIIQDPQCLDNHLLFINTDQLKFYLHTEDNITIGKWTEDQQTGSSIKIANSGKPKVRAKAIPSKVNYLTVTPCVETLHDLCLAA